MHIQGLKVQSNVKLWNLHLDLYFAKIRRKEAKSIKNSKGSNVETLEEQCHDIAWRMSLHGLNVATSTEMSKEEPLKVTTSAKIIRGEQGNVATSQLSLNNF